LTTGVTVWFTGLSGAGKTTVSRLVEKEIRARGYKVEVLDGDVVRENLSKGLGFSKEDRDAHIKRIAYVSKLLVRNGVVSAAKEPLNMGRDCLFRLSSNKERSARTSRGRPAPCRP
jgi:adenylylsulfate kinase-like enzyme